MEKKYFVKIVTSLVSVLLKMTLCLFMYFAFTKKKIIILRIFKTDTLYILTTLTCPLKIYVIGLHNLISMNIFFTMKDHSFSL